MGLAFLNQIPLALSLLHRLYLIRVSLSQSQDFALPGKNSE